MKWELYSDSATQTVWLSETHSVVLYKPTGRYLAFERRWTQKADGTRRWEPPRLIASGTRDEVRQAMTREAA